MDDYKKLAQKLIYNFTADRDGVLQLSSELCLDCKRAANAITELLDQKVRLKKQLQALAQKQMVYIELLLKLFKVSGMSIEKTIELFQAGCVLQPSFEPISLTDFDEILQAEARAKNAEVRAEHAEKKLEAAVKELNRVSKAVDSLSEFIDREVFHIVYYNIYAALRNKSDYIATWKYESKWRGQKGE